MLFRSSLLVGAKDRATSKEQKITITHSSGLAKDEVEKMVSDAKSHEAEDKAKREVAELRNRAEQLAYQMEKLLGENKAKLAEPTVKAVQEGIDEVNKVKASDDKAAIQAALEKLEKASHAAAAELYRAAAPEGGPTPPTGGQGETPPAGEAKKEDVVDAEFRPS